MWKTTKGNTTSMNLFEVKYFFMKQNMYVAFLFDERNNIDDYKIFYVPNKLLNMIDYPFNI